jgi:hypothetical protein
VKHFGFTAGANESDAIPPLANVNFSQLDEGVLFKKATAHLEASVFELSPELEALTTKLHPLNKDP